MGADFGILPGPSPPYNPLDIDDGELLRLIAELVNKPPPPAPPVIAGTAHVSTDSGVNYHATLGRPPLCGGWGGGHVGCGFDAAKNPLPLSTLPGVPPPFSLDSPSASTPPEVRWHGGATTPWNAVAPPSTIIYPPTVPPAVFATAHSSVPNGNLSGTSAAPYDRGSSVACSSAYRYMFGEEANASHSFGFQCPPPSGQSPRPFSGFPHQPFPMPAVAPARAQYPLSSRREFVQGPSSNVPHVRWLPSIPTSRTAASICSPLAPGHTAVHIPRPLAPRPPSPFINGDYASTFYASRGVLALGNATSGSTALPPVPEKRTVNSLYSSPSMPAEAVGIYANSSPSEKEPPTEATSFPSTSGYVAPIPSPSLQSRPSLLINGGDASATNVHGQVLALSGEMSGPPALPSALGKRKAGIPCPLPPTVKAVKVSADSSPSQSVPTQEEKENRPEATASTPESVPQTRVTHKIDWSQPQTWAGKTIDEMDVRKVFSYLSDEHQFKWDKIRRCEWNGCGKEYPKGRGVKSHIKGTDHMDLRRECLRCGFSARLDNFPSRHTQAYCDKVVERNKKREKKLAEKEARRRRGRQRCGGKR